MIAVLSLCYLIISGALATMPRGCSWASGTQCHSASRYVDKPGITDGDACIIACSNERAAACVSWTGGSNPCRCVNSGTNPVESGRYSSYRLWQHDRYDCRMTAETGDDGDAPQTGQTWKINFQEASYPTPSGYEADSGEPYGSRSSGDFYGWDCDISEDTPYTRDGYSNKGSRTRTGGDQFTNSLVVPDRLWRCANEKTMWKILVPNGVYSVTMGFGDAQYEANTAGCTLQGLSLGTGTFPRGTALELVTRTVTVVNQFIEFEGGWFHGCQSISTIVIEESETTSAKQIRGRAVDVESTPPWMNWFEENPVIYVLLGATWLTIALCWCYYTNRCVRCVRSRGKSVATWEPVAATECEDEVLVE